MKTLVVAGISVIAAVGIVELAIRSAPFPAGLEKPPPSTPVLYDVRGRPFFVHSSDRARDARPASLGDLGSFLPLATIAIEDHRFSHHHGIDVVATAGAFVRNALHRRVVSGASTITQQTVKLATAGQSRTLSAKWKEILSALKLERAWTKDRILEAYMNRLDYGNRRVGPVAAAWAYFGKVPGELTFAESIYLAGLPQAPSRLNPWKYPERALARYRHNVLRLAAKKLLPPEIDAAGLLAHPPEPGRHHPPSHAAHFARAATSRTGPGSLESRTTLDLDIQALADGIAVASMPGLRGIGATSCAIVVVDNSSGGVRAMVSSAPALHADLNLALVPRSVGSTLKPFIYLDAIDRRLVTAATLLPDTAEAIQSVYHDYDPKNYGGQLLGPVRVREALGNSLNVPAVVVLGRIGARGAFAKLQSWGFGFRDGFDALGAGFVLGNAEVPLLDMAGAYASLARSGTAWKPVFYVGEPTQPLSPGSTAATAIITEILTDNNARRISFGNASPLDVGARVAVKTGTSSGFRDAWCVGFTKEHTVAVWVGNACGAPMRAAPAVKSAAPVWSSLVRALLLRGDSPVPAIEETVELESCLVAKQTGLLPVGGEPSVREWFLRGTSPDLLSSTMYRGSVLTLPPSFAAWCRSPQNRLGATTQESGFEILFPKDGAVFAFNPALSHSQQTLVLQSTAPDGIWSLNGSELPVARVPLQPGTHRLTLRSGQESRTASFRVE